MIESTNYTLPITESEGVEFKASFNDETIISLVAFANSKGGIVYLGVSDKGEVKGVQLGKETLAEWLNEIKNKTTPVLIPDCEVVLVESKQIVTISISEYPVKPVAFKGRYYKRTGNSNHLLSVSEVANLHLLSLNSSWDYYFDNSHSLSDISLDKVKKAITQMQRNDISVTENAFDFLFKYDLVRENKLSNAAFLLFKEKSSAITTIELGRFQSDIIIKDSDRTKEDVLTQIEQVLSFVRKHINKEIIITDQSRNTQKWQYPMEAIREIVINMIVHRDYRSSSDSIVKVFNDKIEFYNPGRLPDNISIENLLSNNYRSTPRNKLIADFCKDLGLIEKYGSGIRRILSIFEKSGLPNPAFQNISDGFMVTVYAEKVIDKVIEKASIYLNKNQHEVMLLLHENPYATSAQLSDLMGVSQRKIFLNIKFLKENGFIIRDGSTKSGSWKVIDKVIDRVIDRVIDDINDNQQKIVDLLIDNPAISTTKLAKSLGISQRKIFENLKILREKGLIRRNGNNKTGFWEILKK